MKDKTRDSLDRLLHIQKAIFEIERFTIGSSEIKFEKDEMLASAVLFQLSIIGEAIIHVDQALLEKYDYPWFKVRAFRNLVTHEYFDIRLASVWKIVEKDLSEFKRTIEKIIENEF
jgi:uncharacterized protein with HEPN domain